MGGIRKSHQFAAPVRPDATPVKPASVTCCPLPSWASR